MSRTHPLFIASLAACLVIALGSALAVDAHSLRSAEREAVAADARVAGLLVKAARTDFSTCPACAETLNRLLQKTGQLKARQNRFAREPYASLHPAAAEKRRFDLAVQVANDWNGVHREFASFETTGSLCGGCAPAGADRRLKALIDPFGSDSNTRLVLDSLTGAIARLLDASRAFQRRGYDAEFARRFDQVFGKWIGKPSPDTLAVISERIDAVAASLIRKAVDPAKFYKNPARFADPEVREIMRETGIQAFVVYGNTPAAGLTFLTPSFFYSNLDRVGLMIHEEAHLTAGTTDTGSKLASFPHNKPTRQILPRKRAINDSYTFEYLVEDLSRLR